MLYHIVPCSTTPIARLRVSPDAGGGVAWARRLASSLACLPGGPARQPAASVHAQGRILSVLLSFLHIIIIGPPPCLPPSLPPRLSPPPADAGASLLLLSGGHNLDSLLAKYQGMDWWNQRTWGCNRRRGCGVWGWAGLGENWGRGLAGQGLVLVEPPNPGQRPLAGQLPTWRLLTWRLLTWRLQGAPRRRVDL